jgi:hypothetical protein
MIPSSAVRTSARRSSTSPGPRGWSYAKAWPRRLPISNSCCGGKARRLFPRKPPSNRRRFFGGEKERPGLNHLVVRAQSVARLTGSEPPVDFPWTASEQAVPFRPEGNIPLFSGLFSRVAGTNLGRSLKRDGTEWERVSDVSKASIQQEANGLGLVALVPCRAYRQLHLDGGGSTRAEAIPNGNTVFPHQHFRASRGTILAAVD